MKAVLDSCCMLSQTRAVTRRSVVSTPGFPVTNRTASVGGTNAQRANAKKNTIDPGNSKGAAAAGRSNDEGQALSW